MDISALFILIWDFVEPFVRAAFYLLFAVFGLKYLVLNDIVDELRKIKHELVEIRVNIEALHRN